MDDNSGEVTRLARRWADGDAEALDQLIEVVYDDLRRIAHRQIVRTGSGGTVNTTGLVHDAYLKLAGSSGGDWQSRGQFFAFCSKAMRRILIDYARAQGAEKRGGDRVRVPLTPESASVELQIHQVLAVDEALDWLEGLDGRMARIAECRFFGGLSVSETAEALETSSRTVERDWARARGYLYQRLAPGEGFAG